MKHFTRDMHEFKEQIQKLEEQTENSDLWKDLTEDQRIHLEGIQNEQNLKDKYGTETLDGDLKEQNTDLQEEFEERANQNEEFFKNRTDLDLDSTSPENGADC